MHVDGLDNHVRKIKNHVKYYNTHVNKLHQSREQTIQITRTTSTNHTRSMATEEGDYEEDQWYYEREDFKDVTPIEQDDGPFPVVKIDYTKACMYFVYISNFTMQKKTRYDNTQKTY